MISNFNKLKNELLSKITQEQWWDFEYQFCTTYNDGITVYSTEYIKNRFKDECTVGEFYDTTVGKNFICLSFEDVCEEDYNNVSMSYCANVYRMKMEEI